MIHVRTLDFSYHKRNALTIINNKIPALPSTMLCTSLRIYQFDLFHLDVLSM